MGGIERVNAGRRGVVLGGATVAGLGLAGCGSFPTKLQIGAGCQARPAPFLAGPEVLAAWSQPARYFDAHTHIFNARDVPVRQYLAKSVAHNIDSERVRKLIIALAPVAEWLGKSAISPKDEYDELCRIPQLRIKSVGQESADLDGDIERQRDNVARELYREILRQAPEVPLLFNEANADAKSRNGAFLLSQEAAFSEEMVRDALRDGGSTRDPASKQLRPAQASQMSSSEAEALSMRGVLQFVGYMLSPRHHNLRTFIRRYAEGSPSLPLSGCFAAMVDFNYWLDKPCKSSNHEDQVRLHSLLSVLSRGFMMPLVPYNPWVDMLEEDASLKLVKRAVTEFGCVGVKIYPPMGFAPYGNDGLKIGSNEPRPDGKKLDDKLLAFYDACGALGVPVMAHGNDSAGRDDAHDDLASAVGWTALRGKLPSAKQLYVNAGHFGGAGKHKSGDWTDEFVKLMKDEGALRLYGDLGYWNELASNNQYVRDKISRVLATRISSTETAADRVMYGSDWLMLSKEPGWQAYADAIAAAIRANDPSGSVAPKVLGGNALRCYGLTKESDRGTLMRLVDFHVQQGGGPPGWFSA